MIEINENGEMVTFRVRVVPRASKNALAGEIDGAIKVRIASPPVDGAANDELIRFLAKLIGVARSDVEIVTGLASRSKAVRIRGISGEDLARRLQ